MQLLLVEDDLDLATWLVKALEQSSFTVEWSSDGNVAERICLINEFDAVILDLTLPGKNGLALLSCLRSADIRVPVLVLTARDSVEERVRCLNSGADDFLPKPFSLSELEARLFALIRRSRGEDHPRLSCGPLQFDVPSKHFKLGGQPLALTPREHAMLTALIQRIGHPLSKRSLISRVFADSELTKDGAAVEVLMHRLRKKMAGTPVQITTIRGFGYCLELKDESS